MSPPGTKVSLATLGMVVAASFVALNGGVAGGVAGALSADVVVQGNYPAMFTVATDGRIFFSELSTGRIGVFNPADGANNTYFTVPDVCTGADRGLYGLAPHPGFPEPESLYAYATRRVADGSCHNQVLRIDDAGSGAPAMTVLLSDPYTAAHIGGRLLFGPDGNLYVATGDGANGVATAEEERALKAQAQDLDSVKGKVLRMTPAGAAPADNPFGNHTYAYGFRNVFGFDFDPSTGRLWATDNGPDPSFPGDPAGPGPMAGATTRSMWSAAASTTDGGRREAAPHRPWRRTTPIRMVPTRCCRR